MINNKIFWNQISMSCDPYDSMSCSTDPKILSSDINSAITSPNLAFELSETPPPPPNREDPAVFNINDIFAFVKHFNDQSISIMNHYHASTTSSTQTVLSSYFSIVFTHQQKSPLGFINPFRNGHWIFRCRHIPSSSK